MSNFLLRAGPNHLGAFQGSTKPFASSSIEVPPSGSDSMLVDFDAMAKWITVKNVLPTSIADVTLRVGFTHEGVVDPSNRAYFFTLNNQESFSADWKVTKIYLMSDNGSPVTASVLAGLTSVDLRDATIYVDNWSGSKGFGE